MAEREIASIVWDERDDQICVAYVEDEPDHMVATQVVAAELARDAGLSLVSAPVGTYKWVRDPGTPCVATDQRSTGDTQSPDQNGLASHREPLYGVERDSLWIRDPHF